MGYIRKNNSCVPCEVRKCIKCAEDNPQICEECELFLTKDNECVNNCPLFTFGNKVTKLCEGIYNLI